jgi:alpha-L-rhamnosidase
MPDPGKPGFKHFRLRPGIVNSVNWVKCDYKSPYGKIVSNWKVENDIFEYDVSIPANSTATVYIPGKDIRVDGKNIDQSKNLKFIQQEDDSGVFEIESGNYKITSTL